MGFYEVNLREKNKSLRGKARQRNGALSHMSSQVKNDLPSSRSQTMYSPRMPQHCSYFSAIF